MLGLYKYVRPAVFKIDPETAHGLTIKALKTGAVRPCSVVRSPVLEQQVFGLSFPNPVGVAAGFDKNAEVIAPLLLLGFGFTEVGTVTPKPQRGNPRPRIFREPESECVINRMGFPNGGLRVFKPNLEKFRQMDARPGGIVGVNIGMNKEQSDPAADYCFLMRELAGLSDYMVVNVSSPNTPGLRDLQNKKALSALLADILSARSEACPDNAPALLVKLAPDLDTAQREEIAGTLLQAKIDGVILSNTTLDRPDFLPADFRDEAGGLSGAALREKSTEIIRDFYRLTSGKLPIIGVGGVFSAADAYEKIKAGASLVQLYTGMIYEGPGIAHDINQGLVSLLKRDGFPSVADAVGAAH